MTDSVRMWVGHRRVGLVVLALTMMWGSKGQASDAVPAATCREQSEQSVSWNALADTSQAKSVAPALEDLHCALQHCNKGRLTIYRDQDHRTVKVVGRTQSGQCRVDIEWVGELGKKALMCTLPKETQPWAGLLKDDLLEGAPSGSCKPKKSARP